MSRKTKTIVLHFQGTPIAEFEVYQNVTEFRIAAMEYSPSSAYVSAVKSIKHVKTVKYYYLVFTQQRAMMKNNKIVERFDFSGISGAGHSTVFNPSRRR